MSKVYVLGAGASMAFSSLAPSMPKLSKKTRKLIYSRAKGQVDFTQLKKFLKHYFPTWKTEKDFKLQEVLTLLDRILRDKVATHYSKDAILQFYRELVYAMCRVISSSLGKIHAPKPGKSRIRFINSFLKSREMLGTFLGSLEPGDTIISMNYDFLIDYFIFEELLMGVVFTKLPPVSKNNKTIRHDTNYGFDVRNFLMQDGTHRSYQPYKYFQMLKIHGSLNWVYCPKCASLDVTIRENGAADIFDGKHAAIGKCVVCGEKYQPIIVTPTMDKDYSNKFIKSVWSKAKKALKNATEVIFVGYSLPDEDKVLTKMFKKAISASKPKIIVVDRNDYARPRYERLFGNIEYHDKGFIPYIKKYCK